MPITTTVTTTRSPTAGPSVAVHTISFRGLAGAIFICLACSTILYVIAFATTAWDVNGDVHQGLWQKCNCGDHGQPYDHFKAVQATITIGLIGLVVAVILAMVYLCIHTISKNVTILALCIVCFITCLFMLIGFCIFGAHFHHLNFSFALSVIASILCLVAGILAIVQMRKAGVRV